MKAKKERMPKDVKNELLKYIEGYPRGFREKHILENLPDDFPSVYIWGKVDSENSFKLGVGWAYIQYNKYTTARLRLLYERIEEYEELVEDLQKGMDLLQKLADKKI